MFYAIFSLLGASFGNFNLSLDDEYNIGYSILLVGFMFFVTIILFNLLIAILSNTYSKMIERGSVEYGYILYMTKKLKKYNKQYGALILFPAPLHAPLFLLTINYMKDSNQSCNALVVKIGYIFILIIFLLIFSICNLILIPLCWIKVIFEIILVRYILNKTMKTPPVWIIIIHLFLWIIAGNFYLCFHLIFHDIPIFIKSSYCLSNNKNECLLFQEYFFKFFTNLIEELSNKNIEKLTIDEFHKEFNNYVKRNSGSLRLNWFYKYQLFEEFYNNHEDDIHHYLKKLVICECINISQLKIILENTKMTRNIFGKSKKFLVLLNILNLSDSARILQEKKEQLQKL